MADHITLPKSTLLRFADEKTRKISYYDIISRRIIDCAPKRYNTEEHYYPPYFEKWLSDHVETSIGNLHKHLSSFSETTDFLVDYDTLKKDLIRILAIQMIRLPETYSYIMDTENRNSIINMSLETLAKQGMLSHSAVALSQKYRKEVETEENKRLAFYSEDSAHKAIRNIERLFADYAVNFAIVSNDTDASFILTSAHHFTAGPIVFIPVSPRIAYILLPSKLNERKYGSQTIEQDGEEIVLQRYLTITEQNLIDLIPACIKSAQNSMNKHLIASRSFLHRLKESGTLL